jgi:hypothetical protein
MTGMKLRDGDITLYHRRDSKNWQADIRLPDGGRHTLSLRTANEKVAKDKVILIYEDMYFRYKHGLTAVVVLFKDAADAWLKELRAEVRAGSRNERTVIDYEPVVERYLKPYFGNKPMDTIKASDIAQYRSWRRDYWVTGPGSKEVEYDYERNGRVIKRKMAHKARAPSPQTINGENVPLRGILKFACSREWMKVGSIPEVANVKLTKRETRERQWWTVVNGGAVQFGVRYGAVPLQLQPGKTAVEVAKLADLPLVIKTLLQAVDAGELDAAMALRLRQVSKAA